MDTLKNLENVFSMKGGNEDSSYANNSVAQSKVVLVLKPHLEHGIYQNITSSMGSVDGVFRIADLGCATGTNTLLAADTIVRAVKLTFLRHSMDLPEFEVYFADLPSNDFNTLLRTLPPLQGADGMTAAAPDEDKPPATRSYFAAAVSGSHYGRLFPRQTLHFCHSSTSLHWLSQVPAGVEDRSCPAWNGGHVYLSNDAVADAYLCQFRQDLASFLGARAEEILPGGCMFLALMARKSNDISKEDGLTGAALHLEAAFKELVNEGLIEEEKLDSFNIPFYGPSMEELQNIVEGEKSFKIVSMMLLTGLPLHSLSEVREGEEEMFGRTVDNAFRAVYESIVRTHFEDDEDVVNEFFSRIAKRAAAKSGEFLSHTCDVAVAFLVRNRL